MNWHTITIDPAERGRNKARKLARQRRRARVADACLRAGIPRRLARWLKERGVRGHVVLAKQGIISLVAGDSFVRCARRPRAVARLEAEERNWRTMRELGFGSILSRRMSLDQSPAATILCTERLHPTPAARQLGDTLPIVRTLAEYAVPRRRQVPKSIACALDLARSIASGEVARRLEERAAEAFAEPVACGWSHRDLHLRNVMRDADGRPILIDVKSCEEDRVLALDVLGFICRFGADLDRSNPIEAALRAHALRWRIGELRSALEWVDLPEGCWAAVYCLHVLGDVLRRHGPADTSTMQALVTKVADSTLGR